MIIIIFDLVYLYIGLLKIFNNDGIGPNNRDVKCLTLRFPLELLLRQKTRVFLEKLSLGATKLAYRLAFTIQMSCKRVWFFFSFLRIF